MAKRRHPQGQVIGPGVRTINALSLTANAKDLRETPFIYANHAQFSINPNEVFMDFYNLQPEANDPSNVQALFIQRVVLPIGLAKGFATGLSNLIASYEKAMDINVPLKIGRA